MKKVFIDGKAGTTGLRIYERLSARDDIELITLSEELRKDSEARRSALNSCDYAFLCLPDVASREAVSMIENSNVVVIDTSTAHRTNSDWAYGFPELDAEFEEKIKSSKRIAVPGCHASGFIALIYPLVKSGIIKSDENLYCHSITGYSGGGKKMIEEYETSANELLSAPRQYGLSQTHKHLPEMKAICGLKKEPCFSPIVSNFYSGMEVTVQLYASQLALGKTIADVKNEYKLRYNTDIVKFSEGCDEAGFLSANRHSQKDSMEISVYGEGERILLVARYDNLGKGASGAAIECLNVSLGCDKKKGLEL